MSLRRPVLVLLFLAGVPFLFAQSVPTPDSHFPQLRDILRDALRQSPRMIERNLVLEQAEGDLIQARSSVLPSVGGFVSYYKSRDRREDQADPFTADKVYYNLSLNQPVFHWGERRNQVKMGAIRHNIAERAYAQAYLGLAQEIRRAYLNLITQTAQLAAVEYAQQQAELRLENAEARHRSGALSSAELFQPRIDADQARLLTDRTRAALDDTRRTYQTLTGQPAPAGTALPKVIPIIDIGEDAVDRLVAGYLSQDEPESMELRTLKENIAVERLSLANTRTQLRPKVDLVVGASQDEQSYTIDVGQRFGIESYYIGFSANWQIFDGFANRGAVMSAAARLRSSESRYKRLSEELATNVQNAARDIGFAERHMRIQDRLLDSARTFLEFRQEQARQGAASEGDVARGQANYDSALVAALQARAAFLLQLSELLGSITEDPALANVPAKYL